MTQNVYITWINEEFNLYFLWVMRKKRKKRKRREKKKENDLIKKMW